MLPVSLRLNAGHLWLIRLAAVPSVPGQRPPGQEETLLQRPDGERGGHVLQRGAGLRAADLGEGFPDGHVPGGGEDTGAFPWRPRGHGGVLVFVPVFVTSSRPVSQCKTYACIMESHLMGLTVDFSMGFVCFDAASKVGARRSSVLGRKRNKRPHLSEKTCGTRSPTQNPLPLMLHFGRVPCKRLG